MSLIMCCFIFWNISYVILLACVFRGRTNWSHCQVWLHRTQSPGAVLQEGSVSASVSQGFWGLVGGSSQRRGRPHPPSVYCCARLVRNNVISFSSGYVWKGILQGLDEGPLNRSDSAVSGMMPSPIISARKQTVKPAVDRYWKRRVPPKMTSHRRVSSQQITTSEESWGGDKNIKPTF